MTGRQHTYNVGFDAEAVRWTPDGLALVVSGASTHLILHYGGVQP